MNRITVSFPLTCCLLGCLLGTALQAATATHEERRLGDTDSPYGYLEYLPAAYHERDPGDAFPLVIFLHGLGEQGNGTTDLWNDVSRHGPHKLIKNGSTLFDEQGVVVCSPQSSVWWNTGTLKTYTDHLIATYAIDTDRIYITGLSMGGGGTWQFTRSHPELVAACIPICGAAGPGNGEPFLDVPTWAFHAWGDGTVKRGSSIGWVNNIAGAITGGTSDVLAGYPHQDGDTSKAAAEDMTAVFANGWTWVDGVDASIGPHPKLTLYPHNGHNSWSETYRNDAVWEWLFAQSKGGPVGAPAVTISTPMADLVVDQGAMVTFTGAATDDEDGALTGTSLVWSSDRDGQLGTGASISIDDLSLGTHVIQLAATDSDGLTGSAAVAVTVVGSDPYRVLVDFGDPGNTTGGHYNNITDHSAGRVVGATAEDGSPTSVTVRISDGFQGYNTNGTPSDGLYTSSAVEDSFWIQPEVNDTAQVTISGLSTTLRYELRLFASRGANGERLTIYSIGADTRSLDVIDNIDRRAVFADLVADAQGRIVVDLAIAEGSAYGYLGVLDLVAMRSERSRNLTLTSSAGATTVTATQNGSTVYEDAATTHTIDGLEPATDTRVGFTAMQAAVN